MIGNQRDPLTGRTISDEIAVAAGALSDDVGVGLSEIVENGRRGFGLEGEALVEFARECLHQVVERGAKPRHWGTISNPERDVPLHYGRDTNDEIVEGVIADWLASGGGDLEWGDFRFILPEFTQRK